MSDNAEVKVYKPNRRELIYLQSICEKLEGNKVELPSDLKPKRKKEVIYENIYNSIK